MKVKKMEIFELKKDVIKKFAKNEKDTGSVEVQVAILTNRINLLTEHLKIHKKDIERYRTLIKNLGLRK